MLIQGEDEGGSSLDEGKSSDQDGFFSTEVRGADFHQRSEAVVEFGSRPAKRARLLSDSDAVQEAQVGSFDRRGLAQDNDFLEESNGDVGGMSQAHPMSESSSGFTNGLRSRSAGMKVTAPVHACENVQTIVNTKVDVRSGLLNHGTMNGNVGCTIHSMLQDAGDTISTSGDEAVFVIQVRSPTSKQLLHGRKRSFDQEELRSCYGEANSKTGGPHDNGPICYDRKPQSAVTRKIDAEQTGDIKISVGPVGFLNPDTSQDVQKAPSVINGPDKEPVSTSLEHTSMLGALGGKHEGGVRNVAPIAENGPAGWSIPTDGLKPLIVDGPNQLDVGLIRNATKEAETTDMGHARVLRGDTAPISSQEDVQANSNPANEVEAVELVTQSSAKEAADVGMSDTACEEEPGVNTSEVLNVYVRRKRSNASEIAPVDSPLAIEQLKSEDPLGESVIKHYVRRPHRQPDSHSLADVIERPSQHTMTSVSNGEENHDSGHLTKDTSARVEREGNLNVFQRRPKKNNQPPQAEHHTDIPAKVEAEGKLNVFQRRSKIHSPQAEQHVDSSARVDNINVFRRRSKTNPLPQAEHQSDVSARVETEGNVNVFQRRSKMKLPQKELSGNGIIGLQNEVNDKHSPVGYVRADHQPTWLPEGWTLEIRQGGTATRPKDKYYHDHKSGRIFRSKNAVLQFLEGVGIGVKVPLQNKKRPPVPIAPAIHTGVQSPLSKPSLTTQPGLAPPGSPVTNMLPARMKTTPVRPASAVSSEANGTDMTWAHAKGPNGPIWLPWDGAIGTGTGERCQGDAPAKDGGAANNAQLLSSGDGVQLPTGSPASTVKSPSDQADKENRGKLIFRLKRKHPDSEGGKGRSKRPMYEVVHVEKASSSSTSTPTNQEKKLATGERTGQAVPPTPDSLQTHVERISSGMESLSPNVVSGSMSVKAQVEKPIPLEKPSFPSPVVMPTVKQQSTALKPGLENSPTMSNWGIKHNPLQRHSQQLESLQQEPYTALGIPATAKSSGLQHMASYSANHTHVFLDPVHNTIPLSWQYPFTGHASTTTVTTSVPTLGPFPSVSGTVSTTVPVPVFEHFRGVSLNATATIVPCSESGVDSRKRDSASNAKVAEGGPNKAPTAPKSLTKEENTKLLVGLARRLCLTGLEQKKRNLGTLKAPVESRTPATNLEGGEES